MNEDILFEEGVKDEPGYEDNINIDSNTNVSESTSKIDDIEKGVEDERSQVDKSDTIILGSNDINNLRSTQVFNLENYDKSILWTNNNINNSFSTQTVPLNDDVNNYDHICIESHKQNDSFYMRYIVSVEDFKKSTDTGSGSRILLGDISGYKRYVYYTGNPNEIKFGSSYIDTGSYNNTTNIPTNVYGLNAKTLSDNPENPDNPVFPSVSGNVVNNYYNIYCDGLSDNSLSYNIINKPLNEYTTQEGLLVLPSIFCLIFAIVIIIKKGVIPWK